MPRYVYYQSIFKIFAKFSLLFPRLQLLVQVSLSLFPVVWPGSIRVYWFSVVLGFEAGCIKHPIFKRVLYRTIHSLPRQGQFWYIELGIELKKCGINASILCDAICDNETTWEVSRSHDIGFEDKLTYVCPKPVPTEIAASINIWHDNLLSLLQCSS